MLPRRSAFAIAAILLTASCGEAASTGAHRCDSFAVSDERSVYFEVRDGLFGFYVDVEGQSEPSRVFATDVRESTTLMVSNSAAGDVISAETPGVEVLIQGSDAPGRTQPVTSIGSATPATRCDAGDFRIDHVTTGARNGFTIGDQDFPVAEDMSPGGFVAQHLTP